MMRLAGFGVLRQGKGGSGDKTVTWDQRMAAGCILTVLENPKWKSQNNISSRKKGGQKNA
jgi:hypothetical protein